MTATPSPADMLAEEVAACYADPLRFVGTFFEWAPGEGPYQWQIQILRDIGGAVKARKFNGGPPVPPIRFSVSSGHGIGKSTLVAWLVCWLMSTRKDCRITVTANTANQLETKTWAAIQVWVKKCMTGSWFEVTQTMIRHKHFPSSWLALAQTCREENSEAFAGQHSADSSSVFIFDEASAVPDKIWEVAEGGLVKGEPHIYAFGNPTRNSGKFFRANFGSEMRQWNHRSIDARHAGSAVSAVVQTWLEEYGEDSDFFRVRVRGLPPRASELQFISQKLVQEARARDHTPMDDDPLIAGYDAANGGAAFHIITFRRGLDGKNVPKTIRLPGDTPRDVVVGQIAEVMSRKGRDKVAALFGDQAFGAVILARVQSLGYRNVFEINFGEPISPDRQRCGNMRAYIWREMREALYTCSVPDNEEFELDLTGPGFHNRANGQLILESKADMQKRGVKSPDWGDAWALTYARRVAPVPKEAKGDEDRYDIYRDRGGEGMGNQGGWRA